MAKADPFITLVKRANKAGQRAKEAASKSDVVSRMDVTHGTAMRSRNMAKTAELHDAAAKAHEAAAKAAEFPLARKRHESEAAKHRDAATNATRRSKEIAKSGEGTSAAPARSAMAKPVSAHKLKVGDTVHVEGKPHEVKFVSMPTRFGYVHVTTADKESGVEKAHYVDKFHKFDGPSKGGEAKAPHAAASVEKKASKLAAFRDADKPDKMGALQQGAKGGSFYLTASGKKVYVKK